MSTTKRNVNSWGLTLLSVNDEIVRRIKSYLKENYDPDFDYNHSLDHWDGYDSEDYKNYGWKSGVNHNQNTILNLIEGVEKGSDIGKD